MVVCVCVGGVIIIHLQLKLAYARNAEKDEWRDFYIFFLATKLGEVT